MTLSLGSGRQKGSNQGAGVEVGGRREVLAFQQVFEDRLCHALLDGIQWQQALWNPPEAHSPVGR